MRRILILLFITIFTVSMLLLGFGCKRETAPAEGVVEEEAPPAEEVVSEVSEVEKFTVAMVPPALISSYFIECADAAKETVKKYENMKLVVLAPEDETKVDEQIMILEDLIEKKVDLIVLSSGNWKAVAPTLKKAMEAGIEIAIFNQLADVPELEDVDLVSAVGVDEVEGGKEAGKWVADVLNGKGKIAILEGVAGDYWTVRTGKGVDTILADYPEIEVIARQPANWERTKGMEVTETILEANKELDLICAFNDFMAMGAAQAVENAGRRDEIKISGYNGTVEAIEAILDGKIDMTVSKEPIEVGKTLIDVVAAKLMEGKKDEIDLEIRISPTAITIENAEDFLKK